MDNFKYWLENCKDLSLNEQALKMSIEERMLAFDCALEFGTGGMRGVMGPGMGRMNKYTVANATEGFARYLEKLNPGKDLFVALSYDNRANSRAFALVCAQVLGAHNIKSYLFDELSPTPLLSFAVRELKCDAGVMITASHNPPKYNGYKIYDNEGCQFLPEEASKVVDEISNVENMFEIPMMDLTALRMECILKRIDPSLEQDFVCRAVSLELHPELEKKVSIAYSPLHGTGGRVVRKALDILGYKALYEESQMIPDPAFSTLKSPNPEEKVAFERLEELGLKNNVDLLIATDPDADRIGVACLHNGEYRYLTGNESASILAYYLMNELSKKGQLENKMLYSTIVSSDLPLKIASKYGVGYFQTLTGFKYIGEQAKLAREKGLNYLFGYEESYGYLIQDYVRDKDSIQGTVALLDMANYYRVVEGKDLVEKLDDIHKEFGYYKESLSNVYFEGIDGKEKMSSIIENIREKGLDKIASYKVLYVEDYKLSTRTSMADKSITKLTLPKENVLKFVLEDNAWVVLRPSGTEPKLKAYYEVVGKSDADSASKIDELKSFIAEFIK